MNLLNYFWKKSSQHDAVVQPSDFTVATAESVTAGAVSNALCSEPGASQYFKGGVVAYSIASKKEILNIDTTYAEQNNFANPFTTSEMAKSVTKMFKSRFGLSTTGYSLPYQREADEKNKQCALDIKHPYAYICLYDSITDKSIIIKEEFVYDENTDKAIQRATVQAKVALRAAELYNKTIKSLVDSCSPN